MTDEPRSYVDKHTCVLYLAVVINVRSETCRLNTSAAQDSEHYSGLEMKLIKGRESSISERVDSSSWQLLLEYKEYKKWMI